MDVYALLNRWIKPLVDRVNLMIARAVVSKITDAAGLQVMQIKVTKDEVLDNVVRAQDYGFTSFPEENAQAVVLFQQGERKAGLIVAVDDYRYRVVLNDKGEVAMYSKFGNKIVMKSDGSIEATPASGQPFKVVGRIVATGNIESEATVKGATDVTVGPLAKSLLTHVHPVPAAPGTSGPMA